MTESSIVRVYICGAHSTGKTTLLEDVTRQVPQIHSQSEIARIVIKRKGWKREDFDPKVHPETFEELQRLIIEEQTAVESVNNELMRDYIADRGIDPLVYAWVYIGYDAKQRLLEMHAVQDWIERYRESCVFVVYPHKKCMKEDSVRLKPIMEELEQFTETMVQLLRELEIDFIPIKVIERKERAKIVTDEILKRKPIWKINTGKDVGKECESIRP